jgi:hypothetical protein
VSVAQLRPNAVESYAAAKQNVRAPARDAAAASDRIVYVKFDASATSSLDASCSVTLGRGKERLVGSGTGVNTVQGRADAAARAVFNALYESGEALGLEGTAIVETQGRNYVFVSARSVVGRTARVLTGVATLKNSPEEAAIMAALQATNRIPAI